MASSAPILCPSVSTTSWPRHSRMFSASNMPARLLSSATPPFVYGPTRMGAADSCWRRWWRSLPWPAQAGDSSAHLWRYRSAAAPVFTTGPGQQFLIDEIPPQRRVVGVDGPQEPADAVFGVAHPGLEALRDLVQQQAAPRPLGGQGLDSATPDEYPQPLVGGDRLDDGGWIKIGH